MTDFVSVLLGQISDQIIHILWLVSFNLYE